jgi:hypothetical protein
MRINKNVQELKEGDKITTDFFNGEEQVVRTIIWIEDNPKMGSGREVMFDGGNECPCCKRLLGTPLSSYIKRYGGIDAAWVILA